jgi:hypothetical protein
MQMTLSLPRCGRFNHQAIAKASVPLMTLSSGHLTVLFVFHHGSYALLGHLLRLAASRDKKGGCPSDGGVGSITSSGLRDTVKELFHWGRPQGVPGRRRWFLREIPILCKGNLRTTPSRFPATMERRRA